MAVAQDWMAKCLLSNIENIEIRTAAEKTNTTPFN